MSRGSYSLYKLMTKHISLKLQSGMSVKDKLVGLIEKAATPAPPSRRYPLRMYNVMFEELKEVAECLNIPINTLILILVKHGLEQLSLDEKKLNNIE